MRYSEQTKIIDCYKNVNNKARCKKCLPTLCKHDFKDNTNFVELHPLLKKFDFYLRSSGIIKYCNTKFAGLQAKKAKLVSLLNTDSEEWKKLFESETKTPMDIIKGFKERYLDAAYAFNYLENEFMKFNIMAQELPLADGYHDIVPRAVRYTFEFSKEIPVARGKPGGENRNRP